MTEARLAFTRQGVTGLIAVLIVSLAYTGSAAMALTLTSPAFEPGGKIPSKYTCEGDDVSPPLRIAGGPDGTKSFALILDDPDVPDPKAPIRIWVHWVVYNIPPNMTALAENVGSGGVPAGTALD